jgi:hypothetical protein
VLHYLRRLLAVEKWRIDDARGHHIDRDASLADLLGESPCERFYRGLRTSVGGLHASSCTEQRGAGVNDPSVVGNALRGFLHGEVQPLSIDSGASVEFLFGNLHERLLFDVTGALLTTMSARPNSLIATSYILRMLSSKREACAQPPRRSARILRDAPLVRPRGSARCPADQPVARTVDTN